MMRKLPQFITRLFAILMKMLLDVEDEALWNSAEAEHEDAGETSNYSVGQDCLDRLAIALGGNTIVPIASEQLPAYLAAPEWQKHHAALIALAQIAEGCSKGKDKTAEERRIAICIFDDVAEQCREAALKYYDTYLPFLLEACNDENPDVRQAAVYGLGVCAEHGGSAFKSLVGEALSRLNVVLRHPNAVQPENVMAYDNAVSALGKICNFHRDSIDLAQVSPAWLNCLPIKGDLIEAKVVHDQLCSMVERSDRELLGPNNEYLPKVVQVFAEVLCAGKDLVTEQTASRMITLLRQLQQTLPPATLASIWSSLQPQQQLTLQ